MPTGQMTQAIQHLRRAVLWRDGAGLSDAQLLEHFIERRDEAAFETLVRRHGPMVLGVCRRLLRNYHDADDAFQATFLVLVRKAASIAPKEMVGNWLYGVAYQTALKGRAVAAKRRTRERQVPLMPEPETKSEDLWHDLQAVLDQELSRLPDKYRVPFVLCDLEGKTHKEAARRLGWPDGTFSVRLARARKMLAKRLTRHGFAITGAALAAVLSQNAASACVPPSVVSSTIKAAGLLAAGQMATGGVVSGEVAALTKGVLKAMLLTKVKTAMAVVVTMSIVALGGGALSYSLVAGQQAGPKGQQEGLLSAGEPGEDGANNKPAPIEVKSPEAIILGNAVASYREKLLGEWVGKDPDGVAVTLLFGQNNFSKLIAEDGRRFKGTYSVDFKQTPHHLDFHWTEPFGRFKTGKFRTIMEFKDEGQFRIELTTEDKARPKDFTDNSAVFKKKTEQPGVNKKAPQTDIEKMQGEWTLVDGEVDGEKIDVEGFGTITIQGDTMTLPFGEPNPASFKLDATKTPKQITVVLKSLGTDGKMNGIYSLDGDDLKFCFANKGDDIPRPKDFVTNKGSDQRLFILKRETLQSIDRKQTKADVTQKDGTKGLPVGERRFRQYQIECTLVQVDPIGKDLGADGKGKVLAQPVLFVLEGRESNIFSGGQMAVPGDKDNAVEFLEFGVWVRVKMVGLNDGRVRLETVLERTEVDTSNQKNVLVRARSVRSIARVKLGEAIKLVERDDQGQARHWVRVKVAKEEFITSRTPAKADSSKRPTFQEVARRLGLSEINRFLFAEAVQGYRDAVPVSDLAREFGMKEIDVFLLQDALRRDAVHEPENQEGNRTKGNQSGLDYRVPSGEPVALDFGFPINKAPGDGKQLFSFWAGFFGH